MRCMSITTNSIDSLLDQYKALKKHLTPSEDLKVRKLLGLEPPDFIEWAESEFYIPETGLPIVLYPLQKAAIREAMRKDDDGKFIYSTVMWGDIKKSAKTSIGAARALYAAIFQTFAMVRVIGNDRDQAQSRLFHYVVRCLKLNKALADRVGAHIKLNSITFANNSYIEAIAVDPEGEAGGGDDLTVFTELWGARTSAHIKLWSETTLSPIKYGYSQRWCESYAGIRGQSPLLENIYDKCVVEDPNANRNTLGGRRISDEYPFFTDDSGNIFCMWNREPHLPWQTQEYYDNERAVLMVEEFERIHRNAMQDSTMRFVDSLKLKTCYGDAVKLRPDTVLILASDAAYSGDTYGLVGVTYDPERDIIQLAFEQTWQAPSGYEIDLSEPEAVVKRLAQKYTVLVWTYDPYQLKRTAQSLAVRTPENEPITTYEFSQQSKRAIADKALLDRINTGDLIIPEESITATHILNADAKFVDTNKIRLIKRAGSRGGPIDLAVCLSMACYIAVSERERFPMPVRLTPQSSDPDRAFVIDNSQDGGADNSMRSTLPDDRMALTLPANAYDR